MLLSCLQHPQVCSCPASWPCIPLLLPCSGCLRLFPVLQLCSVGLCSALLLEPPPAAPACGKRCFPRASLAALLTWKHLSPLVFLHPALSQRCRCSGSAVGLREQSKPGQAPGSGSTAAARFAAQLPFPKSEVAEAKRR